MTPEEQEARACEHCGLSLTRNASLHEELEGVKQMIDENITQRDTAYRERDRLAAERDEARAKLWVERGRDYPAVDAFVKAAEERDRLAAENARLTAVYHLECEEIMGQRDRLAERLVEAEQAARDYAMDRFSLVGRIGHLRSVCAEQRKRADDAEQALALQAGARGREP